VVKYPIRPYTSLLPWPSLSLFFFFFFSIEIVAVLWILSCCARLGMGEAGRGEAWPGSCPTGAGARPKGAMAGASCAAVEGERPAAVGHG